MRTSLLSKLHLNRTSALIAAAIGLAMVLGWLVLSQGPLAPI